MICCALDWRSLTGAPKLLQLPMSRTMRRRHGLKDQIQHSSCQEPPPAALEQEQSIILDSLKADQRETAQQSRTDRYLETHLWHAKRMHMVHRCLPEPYPDRTL